MKDSVIWRIIFMRVYPKSRSVELYYHQVVLVQGVEEEGEDDDDDDDDSVIDF